MGERRRKRGRRMEKTLWVRDVERVGEEWRKRATDRRNWRLVIKDVMRGRKNNGNGSHGLLTPDVW